MGSIYSFTEITERMKGRAIAAVHLDKSKDRITFQFADGGSQVFGVEGDCCSHSWIEHLEMPPNVTGATVTAIEEGGTVDATDDDALNPRRPPYYEGDVTRREHECLKVYNTTFRTDRGDIVLEFRNSSNGYYGGSLTDESGDD